MEKPKRPLSSFNLFYRYKRSLVLEKVGDGAKDDVLRILSATAGLEETPLEANQQPPFSDEINTLRRNRIREALRNKITPNDNGKRRHRKAANSLGISFSEMGKLMTTCWKGVDPFGKEVFEELSEEGRHIYRVQMDIYNELNPKEEPKKSTPDKPKLNNNRVRKQSVRSQYEALEKAVSEAGHNAATFPAAAAFPAAPLPHGVSIPVQMLAHHNRMAAFQRIPSMMATTNPSFIMPVAQFNPIMASRQPPSYGRTNEMKREAKPSSRAAANMDILAAAAAAAAEPKRTPPTEPTRSLPLKKRFKRP
mmetsp:Transcript_23793/g.40497  ORF Transcript_23793/g.40497 Transcript_23793/m.40497 type:complete len:307 (-) Transcript_23793:113-1033(-)